ncbi:hypothetical protein GCM10010277_72530 [Streptomyces longisporoflavus]|uniref:hypothetical protein n=1 Tax=Streptomyces longisporoflavus TaxID=28044 RepID=UPI00167E8887|nr:hypothetical protein [Streptomyces longisporoflavus]GGV65335.1 hypothetical protein GCM10010277_72530 [Streptomyces longisporoflavus]
MKNASEFTSPPSDYNVIVPDGWFQLPLAPEHRDRGIVALADQQFRGVDNAPHIKKQFMREMQRKAKSAYGVGGTELYISTLSVGQLPLASSLLISIPGPDEWPKVTDVEELAEHLASKDGSAETDAEVDVVTLAAAGRAVRQRRKEAPDPESQLGNELPNTLLTYYVPIPATKSWLLLNFSTPMDPLADQMVELFDVVAGTLHWD